MRRWTGADRGLQVGDVEADLGHRPFVGEAGVLHVDDDEGGVLSDELVDQRWFIVVVMAPSSVSLSGP